MRKACARLRELGITCIDGDVFARRLTAAGYRRYEQAWHFGVSGTDKVPVAWKEYIRQIQTFLRTNLVPKTWRRVAAGKGMLGYVPNQGPANEVRQRALQFASMSSGATVRPRGRPEGGRPPPPKVPGPAFHATLLTAIANVGPGVGERSEERRVGKEC